MEPTPRKIIFFRAKKGPQANFACRTCPSILRILSASNSTFGSYPSSRSGQPSQRLSLPRCFQPHVPPSTCATQSIFVMHSSRPPNTFSTIPGSRLSGCQAFSSAVPFSSLSPFRAASIPSIDNTNEEWACFCMYTVTPI